jgi:hypothetical protein
MCRIRTGKDRNLNRSGVLEYKEGSVLDLKCL